MVQNSNNIYFISFLVITNPKVAMGAKESTKAFNFDFSYWSHDVSPERKCAFLVNKSGLSKKVYFYHNINFFTIMDKSSV